MLFKNKRAMKILNIYIYDRTYNFLSKLKQTNFILNFSYFCVKNNLLQTIHSSPIRI